MTVGGRGDGCPVTLAGTPTSPTTSSNHTGPPMTPSYTVGPPPPSPLGLPHPTPSGSPPQLQITAARAASNLHTTPAVQKRCPREFIVLAKYDSGELMMVKASEKTKNYEHWDFMMCLLSTYKSILWKQFLLFTIDIEPLVFKRHHKR